MGDEERFGGKTQEQDVLDFDAFGLTEKELEDLKSCRKSNKDTGGNYFSLNKEKELVEKLLKKVLGEGEGK